MGEDAFKKASEYMRKGAKLTSETCPICGFLLLKIDEKRYCPHCEREVIVAETREEYMKASAQLTLNHLKEVLVDRIGILTGEMEASPGDSSLMGLLNDYLTLLEKVEALISRGSP